MKNENTFSGDLLQNNYYIVHHIWRFQNIKKYLINKANTQISDKTKTTWSRFFLSFILFEIFYSTPLVKEKNSNTQFTFKIKYNAFLSTKKKKHNTLVR